MRLRRIPALLMIAGAAGLLAPPASAAAPAKAAASKAAPKKKATPIRKPAVAKPAARPAVSKPPVVTKPAPTASPALIAAVRTQAKGAIGRVYAARGYRPLWAASGRIGPAADAFIEDVENASLDGLKPSSYKPEKLRALVAASRGGTEADIARAEMALSDALGRYIRDMRKPPRIDMIYADAAVKPRKIKPDAALRAASIPVSFGDYVATMGWMSPHYVRMRALIATAQAQGASRAVIERLRLNRERARVLPGPYVHHVVVDSASGRLWYYGGGKQQGTMRVVVGTYETQTPMLAGMMTWAILNPYWNVPDYLTQNKIAPKVLAGQSLKSLKMEVLSDWTQNARVIDQRSIDWRAVANGSVVPRVRELPGPANSMGRVKFIFPNDEGIYLHDSPARDLFTKPDRHFSNGCIRLENARELGQWLLGTPIPASSPKNPEHPVALRVPVPVYVTYLTAIEDKGRVAFLNDIYQRDGG